MLLKRRTITPTCISQEVVLIALAVFRNIEDRYNALRTVAETHALVAFGLTIFEVQPSSSSRDADEPAALEVRYAVHNFNFLMLSQNEYAVNADSMQFLVDNGFDFNEQFRSGIPYTPGDDVVGG